MSHGHEHLNPRPSSHLRLCVSCLRGARACRSKGAGMMLEFENLPRGDLIRLHAHLAGGHVRPPAAFPFETGGQVTLGNAVNLSALDYVAGGNGPRKQLRPSDLCPEVLHPVARSRVEETTARSFIQMWLGDVAVGFVLGLFLLAITMVCLVLDALF